MKLFYKIIDRTTRTGIFIASLTLLGIMAIIMANVLYRISGGIIPGTYDLVELMIIVVVGFSMAYTALKRTHISAKLLVDRFSERNKAIIDGITSLIGSGFWMLVAIVSVRLTMEKAGLGEKTELLGISFIPFRWIWVFTLILFGTVLAINGIKSIREALKK